MLFFFLKLLLGKMKPSHQGDGEYVCMRVCANTINGISS